MTMELGSDTGLRASFNANGSLRRFDCGDIALTLFVGNELEGGPTNLYLRRHGGGIEWIALLGPRSRTRFQLEPRSGALLGYGRWGDIDYCVQLRLAAAAAAWFWHVQLENHGRSAHTLDLTYTQDLALSPYGAVRLNEYYVSQYIDHAALPHPARGFMVASRQNLAIDGRHPWSLIGSLRRGAAFATDARQFYGLAARSGGTATGLAEDLPSVRLQHEHSLVAVRDAALRLEPGSQAGSGFFGLYLRDHAEPTGEADLERFAAAAALPEAAAVRGAMGAIPAPSCQSLFSSAPSLRVLDLDAAQLRALFGAPWRHVETGAAGELLSFFHGAAHHVVSAAKERQVLRPHGQLLRSGRHTTPDETSLTSTAWMSGVFHSMLTQGHVSINRLLSTVHSYLGLFRSHGQRVFVRTGAEWQLLDVPSAFEMSPRACVWIYRYEQGEIHVRSEAGTDLHEMTLRLTVVRGPPLQFLISHHIALNGDDGSAPGPALWQRQGQEVTLRPAPGSELAQRFPRGSFSLCALPQTCFEQVGGDELLFLDGRSRGQPYLCCSIAATLSAGVRIGGDLVGRDAAPVQRLAAAAGLEPPLALHATAPAVHAAAPNPLTAGISRLADMAPWYAQNAWVHYLAPRGLEQYSGGGWGTRDVCQGPVELLLALGQAAPIRDLLLRVLGQQNADGDWPQWFMFFERERNIRPADSHGDIVFWPVLVLAQYLIASGDAGILEERVRFFDSRGSDHGEHATVWEHVLRALGLIGRRVIPGTALAIYGHGDWNDSLQPLEADMRHHLCSAWTVTLQFQTLRTLGAALRSIGRAGEEPGFTQQAQAVRQDFQRLLLADGVLAGYALFAEDGGIRHLLHPRDDRTGIRYSSLAMIHAILEDLLTPEQARAHLRLIGAHLSAPDGVRLFDQPLAYHGGRQYLFQRAETATFFGREIGLMYTHAHLRYAQALAHVGEAQGFFQALCQANPIGIASIVPRAALRQANCYYSSSDAAFADRYQAGAEYRRIKQGTIALDGGWRVYSSGAGIALGLIIRRFLGLSREARQLRLDPVIPAALDGLRAHTSLADRPFEVEYRIGAKGCGVRRVELNGQPLAFTREDNPHRPGAALVAMNAMEEQLRSGHNALRVEIG